MAQNQPDVTHTTLEEITDDHPLVTALGDHSKTRFLAALLTNHPEPLNISELTTAAGLNDRHAWYNAADDLERSGLIQYADTPGADTDVKLTDPATTPATRALQELADHTNAAQLATQTD